MQVFLVYIVLQPKMIIMKKECDMKRTFIIFIVVMLLLAVLPCFGGYTSRASWEEQIHGMGYLILHLSGKEVPGELEVQEIRPHQLSPMSYRARGK
jgi:membrane associated rhomboid family serine protease